jgi:16S rRNA (guanine(966)-N(2))-methyltransferase RsmD
MDRMRESVFATLGDLTQVSFLDLFSGSGIIALEAASRGAEPVETVEMDPLKRKILLKNISIAPVRIKCRFVAVELYLKRAKGKFDIVFCDPPFPYKYKGELLQAIANSPLLSAGARLLVHRPREESWRNIPEQLRIENSKTYGRSVVDFFKKE